MTLSDDELDRYARQIVLPQFGGVAQRKLKEARIAVIGAGGIGSAVIPALAGAGIGQLTIIDDDMVEGGNLHRQTIFRERDVGYSKADLALQFVQRLNRFVKAQPVQARIDADVKDRATAVLESMGLTVSDAVRILLTRTANEGALPLELVSHSDVHDAWFRAKVLQALTDERPHIEDAEAEARFAERRAAAYRKAGGKA